MADDKKAKKEEKPKDSKAKDPVAEEKEGAEGEAVEGAEESPRRFTPRKIILFIVLPLLLLIGGGSGAYFMGLLDGILGKKGLHCEGIQEGDKNFEACSMLLDAGAGLPGAFLDIPNVIVNLNSAGKQPRFLKISLKLEMENDIELKKMQPVLPRVVDQFQMYLRELRIEDLRGTSGVYRMKIELLSRVRAAAPHVKVRDVLFQEILVQ